MQRTNRAAQLILISFLWLLPSSQQGNAAPLFFGTEDTTGFLTVGTIGYASSGTSTTSLGSTGWYDSNFVNTYLSVNNGTTVADPPANYFKTPTVTSQTVMWFHGNFGTSVATTTNNQQGVWMYSPDGVGRVYLRVNGTSGTLKLSTANAARTFTDVATASGTFSASLLYQMDWKVDFTCSGAGASQVYLNGTLVLTYTGNLCTDAATQLNQVGFAGLGNGTAAATNCNSSNSTCWSEIVIGPDDSRSYRMRQLQPQSSGNTQSCTPNTVANVQKSQINDGTFVSDDVNNDLCQWKVPTAAPLGIWTVKSVSQEVRALVSLTGPQHFDYSWRIGGADFLAGSSIAPTTAFSNFRLQQDTSPATSSAWTINEVFNTSTNTMNIGIKTLP